MYMRSKRRDVCVAVSVFQMFISNRRELISVKLLAAAFLKFFPKSRIIYKPFTAY